MPEITVWTKQNKAVLDQLSSNGRFIADVRYIRKELEDTTDIMLFIYKWLADHVPTVAAKPADVSLPVWVSFTKEATMIPEPGYVVLELKVDSDMIAHVDVAKWTRITNYSYIPADKADEEQHSRYLEQRGINNADAILTGFYPELKEKIISSWERLFDDSINLGGTVEYGLLWEVRQEWIQDVIM